MEEGRDLRRDLRGPSNILTDCDQDVLQIKVTCRKAAAPPATPAAEVLLLPRIVKGELEFIDDEKLFDPDFVYRNTDAPQPAEAM